MTKILSGNEYLKAQRGDDEMEFQRGMTANKTRKPPAPLQSRSLWLKAKRAANRNSSSDRERSSRRRKAFRLLDAYAGQFY